MTRKLIKAIVILSLIMGYVCPGVYAQSEAPLTNKDVVKMSKLGLAPASIIRKMKASSTSFDVSVDALGNLKSQGVNKDVINAMIDLSTPDQPGDAQGQTGQGAAAPAKDAPKDLSDPRTWRAEGIYYYNKSDPSNLFVQVDATQPSGTKSGGYGTAVAQSYSGGWARNKQEMLVSEANSKRQIHHTSPVFYFYFSTDNNFTPNQFALVSFIQKRKDRLIVTGSSNAYGSTTGIDEKQKVEFTYDNVGDGIFKVYPKSPLKEGEYCFIYTGNAKSSFSDVVYDFGISSQ